MMPIKMISIVLISTFFFFADANESLALSEPDACNIIASYTPGTTLNNSQKSAGIFLKSIEDPCNGDASIATKLINICPTTFCGEGLLKGIDVVKPTLQGTGISTGDSIIRVILGLITFALPFAGLFAFVGLIYGGFLYLTSFAEDQTETAKKIILWSGLGLLLIFIAYPLVSTLIRLE
jgi:hypothetical protein